MVKDKKFIKRLSAGFTAGLCALSMTGIPVNADDNAVAVADINAEYEAAYTSSLPSVDDVVKEASKYLGTRYTLGGRDPSVGFDCSGFIYYVMKSMGYTSTGFMYNLPMITDHWLTSNAPTLKYKDNEAVSVTYEKYKVDTPGGGNDVEGKTLNYWECPDGSTISPGSVVVATSAYNDNDGHAWIYLGEFNGAEEVRSYLKSLGIADSTIDSTSPLNIVEYSPSYSGYAGNHWRIECFGGTNGRVVIDNGFEPEGGSQGAASALVATAVNITDNKIIYSVSKKSPINTQVGKSPVDGTTATYGVYSDKDATNKIGEVVIGEDGKGHIQLPRGTYYIKELVAPTGYELDTNIYPLVSHQETVVTEDYQTGDIKVTKSSEDALVNDITFELSYIDNGQTVTKTATTDASGIATFSDLLIYNMTTGEPITYSVSEVNVASKYAIPDIQNVTLNNVPDWTATVPFENKLKKFVVEVTKTDSVTTTAQGDASLAGAVYGLYKDGELVDQYTTDANGYFKTKEYVCGNYTLKEITASAGYKLDPTEYAVGAEPEKYTIVNNTITTSVKEEVIDGKIDIIKHSDEDDATVENLEVGVEFEVYLKSAGSYENADETERDYLKTDENGHAVTKNLPYGTYTVHQKTSTNDSEFVADFDVYIAEDDKTYEYILNDKPFDSYVRVEKVDAETGNVILTEGAGFQIYDSANNLISMDNINTFYTNAKGYLITPDALPYGEYVLVEVQAPEGYVLDSTPVSFSVTADNATVDNATNVVTIQKADKAQKGKIAVKKTGEIFKTVGKSSQAIDKDTTVEVNKPVFEVSNLAGAEFDVIATQDIVTADGTVRVKAGSVVAHLVTDANGYAETGELYLGKYTLRETKAPTGYVLSTADNEVELVYADQTIAVNDAVAKSINNEHQKLNISLNKIMEQDAKYGIGTNKEYANVVFGLYANEDIVATDGTKIAQGSLISVAKVGENSVVTFDAEVPFGKYYVQEIKTDSKYKLNDTKYDIEFTAMAQDVTVQTVNIEDVENEIKRGNILGLKVDEEEKGLSGATLGLFAKDETVFTVDTAYETVVSDKNGYYEFTGVPCDTYVIKELDAPDGYIISDEIVRVEVDDVITQDVNVPVIVNEEVKVEFSKTDVYGEELKGAEMSLTNSKNEVIDTWVSDGKNHVITGLVSGEYTLKEVATPDGYVVATDITFSIDDKGTVTLKDNGIVVKTEEGVPVITMIDDATKVNISKQDITNGKELEGATLQVIDKDGNVVEEWVSTNKVHYIEAKLIAGQEYTLREITAPNGYEVANDVKFTVNKDGTVKEVVMYDEAVTTTTTQTTQTKKTTTSKTTTTKTTTTKAVNTPRTGDNRSNALGYTFIGISGLVVTGLFVTRRRKANNDRV